MNDDLTLIDHFGPQPTNLTAGTLEGARARLAGAIASPSGHQRRPRARVALVTCAVVATSAVGVGVAAATTGMGFSAFTDTFDHWSRTVDPAEAQRVATAPGPDGTVFSVLVTPDSGCRTAVVESPQSAAAPLPSSFTDVTSNWCSTTVETGPFGTGADVTLWNGIAGFNVRAGEAVRAEVTTPAGEEFPALLVDGLFWGWFPSEARATLIGYASDGSVMGREYLGQGGERRGRSLE